MQSLGKIDPLAPGRPQPSERDRARLQQKQRQQAREAGYQKLAELCALGESDAAAHLAERHPEWGYVVLAGEICDRSSSGSD